MKYINKVTTFLKEVWSELKKVVWPGKNETLVLTSVVLFSVALVTLLFWILDNVLSTLLQLII